MTNLQLFSLPKINVKLNRDSLDPDIFPQKKSIKIKIIWDSLLGKNTHDVLKDPLLVNKKFYDFVKETGKIYKANSNNYKKFPKMREDDWK